MPSAAYILQRDRLDRRVQWVLEIDVDRCTLVYSVGSCTASDLGDGRRCHYSWNTCQVPSAYTKGTRTLRFCLNDRPWTDENAPAYPMLIDAPVIAQEIDSKDLTVYPETIKAVLLCDYNPLPFDSDKLNAGAVKFNTAQNGEFWRNLAARSPNILNRPVRLKRGFNAPGFLISDFEQVGPTYRLSGFDFDDENNRVTISARSPLVDLAKIQVPFQISDDNTLQLAINTTDTTLKVKKASEYPDPSLYSRFYIYVRIDNEAMRVTARNTGTNELTVVRARLGTTAASHAGPVGTTLGAKVKHTAFFGTDNGASAATPRFLGQALQDLLEWAQIDPSEIDSASFNALDIHDWPTADVLATLLTPKKVVEHLTQLRDSRSLIVAVNAAGKIMARPLSPSGTFVDVTDEMIVGDGSGPAVRVVSSDDDRLTRCALNWAPSVEQPKADTDFSKRILVIDTELEDARNFDDVKTAPAFVDLFLDPGASLTRVRAIPTRIMVRRRYGIKHYEFELDIKDATINVLDGIYLTTKRVTGTDGTATTRPCIVTKAKPVFPDRMLYRALDLAVGGRYFKISPDSLTDDYDTASTDQRNRYGFWGDATTNRVGAALEDGYLIG